MGPSLWFNLQLFSKGPAARNHHHAFGSRHYCLCAGVSLSGPLQLFSHGNPYPYLDLPIVTSASSFPSGEQNKKLQTQACNES